MVCCRPGTSAEGWVTMTGLAGAEAFSLFTSSSACFVWAEMLNGKMFDS